MRRFFIITLLIGLALWLAGCEVVETHYVGRRHGFHAPPPVIVHSRPVYSPPPVIVHSRPVYSPRGHHPGGRGQVSGHRSGRGYGRGR